MAMLCLLLLSIMGCALLLGYGASFAKGRGRKPFISISPLPAMTRLVSKGSCWLLGLIMSMLMGPQFEVVAVSGGPRIKHWPSWSAWPGARLVTAAAWTQAYEEGLTLCQGEVCLLDLAKQPAHKAGRP